MFNRSEFRGAVTGLALVAALLLAAVSFDSSIVGEALQSLRFHIAALLALAVIALVAAGGWRRAIVFALVLGASVVEGGVVIYRQQAARLEVAAAPHAPLLKLLSFNILGYNENGAAIADFIKGSGADVVVVMEAAPLFPHLASLGEVYRGRAGCELEATCDLMLLSREPLGDVAFHSLSPYWRNRLATATTRVGDKTITIAGAHMVKPYFDWASVAEAHAVRRTLDQIEGPLVLAGDFNAAAWSDNIDWLVRNAGLLPGPGYPATWPVRLGPLGVPIDNVFTRAPLVIEAISALEDPMGSNHRGLLATISLAAD